MNSYLSRRFSDLFRMLSVCALAWISASAVPVHAAPDLTSGGKLAAGIEYVVPPFIAGSKVRTPEGIDTLLVDDLARRLSAEAKTVRTDPSSPSRLLDEGKAKLLLVPVANADSFPHFAAIIPTGYSAGAMAIMRTDTDIKKWEDLKGRTVCLAEGGQYPGQMAARYGAVEKVFKAPADSLLALRTGGCDAAVHDSTMLTALLQLPEWKKFSARLPVQDVAPLAFVIPAKDAESVSFLTKVAKEWANSRYLEKITKSAVNDIAFEVYLDQTVTDCH